MMIIPDMLIPQGNKMIFVFAVEKKLLFTSYYFSTAERFRKHGLNKFLATTLF